MLSCSSVDVKTYSNTKPAFDLENFFNGELEGHGLFQDRSGKVTKQMRCWMSAVRENDQIVISEKFEYSDGTTDSRVWKIKKMGDGQYIGTAGDVIGDAKIQVSGFAFNMKYILRLKVDQREVDVRMDDWMYRMSDNVVINKTKMSKWGIHLGDVTFTIIKK